MFGNSERPAELRAFGAGVVVRQRADSLRGNAGNGFAPFERPLLDTGGIRLETGRGVLDERLVRKSCMDNLAGNRVRERDVRADIQTEPAIGPLCGSRAPGINDV